MIVHLHATVHVSTANEKHAWVKTEGQYPIVKLIGQDIFQLGLTDQHAAQVSIDA